MKIKILTLASLGILTTLIIYSCGITSGNVTNLNNTICSNYTDMNTLQVGLIHEMTKSYKENQLLTINQNNYFNEPTPGLTQGDARSIWFDLETLKAFIYQIEINAKNNADPVSSTELGVRIYYASYPDEIRRTLYDDLQPANGSYILPEDYEKRHTLVIIPTINREGRNVDFDPLDFRTYFESLGTGINISKYAFGSQAQMLALTGINKSPSNRSGAQNHGGLRPPPPLDKDGNF